MRMTYVRFFGKCACIFALAAVTVMQGAAEVSAYEYVTDDSGRRCIVDSGRVYTPAYDDDDNWLGYYLDEDGYVSYVVDDYVHTEYPYPNDDTHPEVQYGSYDGYDLSISRGRDRHYIGWLTPTREERTVRNPHYSIKWWDSSEPYYDYSEARIRIPSSIKDIRSKTSGIVYDIKGSCAFKEFDLDPDNLYMKCVDNVIFSRDVKTLMSYAQYDERREYTVPEGTETIGTRAFSRCHNLERVYIPGSVKNIGNAFYGCNNLKEIVFASFDTQIYTDVLGYEKDIKTKLCCTSRPAVRSEGEGLFWDKTPGASYYEVYQKVNGEYKLLDTKKGNSCKLSALKPGKEYIFAVKPMAVIPAAEYDRERDRGFPESFTIEGTMSEDILIKI